MFKFVYLNKNNEQLNNIFVRIFWKLSNKKKENKKWTIS